MKLEKRVCLEDKELKLIIEETEDFLVFYSLETGGKKVTSKNNISLFLLSEDDYRTETHLGNRYPSIDKLKKEGFKFTDIKYFEE